MDTLTRSIVSLLLDTAAKGTVLLLLACLAAWLCRRSSAALRHSIWCLTMGGLLALPIASWGLPAWQIPILPPEPVEPTVVEVVENPTPAPSVEQAHPLRDTATVISIREPSGVVRDIPVDAPPPFVSMIPPVENEIPVIQLAPLAKQEPPPSHPFTRIEWTSLLVSMGWLLGVSLFGALLLIGLWRTVTLRRTSLIVADGDWPGLLAELRQRLGLSRSVELREHAKSVVPLTWGIWRPVVLLPKLAREWSEPMQRAVLLHELAHVQRGDVACQVLGRLTCVLYWFHPLAWFALRQLRQEREQACDDAVVQTGEKASDYAEQLLQVARLCCAPRGLSLGVAMAEGSSLERRVVSLFDSARSHGPVTRRVAVALFVIGGAILAGLSPIEPTASMAEPVKKEIAPGADGELEPEKPAVSDKSDSGESGEPESVKPSRITPVDHTAKVQAALKTKGSLHFDNAPLTEILRHIADTHGIGIALDSGGLLGAGMTEETPVTIQVDGITLASALDQLLVPLKLGYFVENEVLMITSAERIPGGKKARNITGQIVNEKSIGIAGAEVVLVVEDIVGGQLTKQGRVIASAIADPLGHYELQLPPEVAEQKNFGAIWARAKGHVAARGHWSTVIPALSKRRAALTLATTEGTRVQVLDASGKPLTGVRVVPTSVGIPEGVGYPLPPGWEEQSQGTTDYYGKALLRHVDPEAVKELELIPPGDWGVLRYDQNYFLNVRPEKAERHFSFRLPETGAVSGQLVVAEGATLPVGLELTLESYSHDLPHIRNIVRVPVEADGKFHADKLAVGAVFVPAFLPEDQPLRANVPARIEVAANKITQLEIPVAPGVKVSGRVQKSDTQAGVKDYELTLIYGQTISNQGSDFSWLKFDIETDAEGRFECLVPPGPINVRLTSYAEGYVDVDSWLPKERRGTWGQRFEVPAEESFDLGTIDLVKSVGVKGRLVDMKNLPLADWMVFGYPHVPGFTQSETMNSMAGVSTDQRGYFQGSYPQTYPPAYWKVSQRVWRTKYEFDDIKYAGQVISRDPLVLQVDLSKRLGEDEEIPLDTREPEPKAPAVPPMPAKDTSAKGAAPVDAQPAFTEFVVNIQPFETPRNGYVEELKFLANGTCWYKVEGREADANLAARAGAVFDHQLSPERIRKLNQLLSNTKWLTADDGAKGSPPGLHATTYRLTLKRNGQEKSIVWSERGPEPYRSLLHFCEGIAAQERRIYRHDYLAGQEGSDAWQEIGRELAALRGEPYGKSPYDIDYARYLPIAIRNVRDFHGKPDEELLTSVRLIGHLREKSEIEFIHRMAQDRSGTLRQEVAWTLGRIHDPKSLPVLFEMMSGAGTRWEVGFELIRWGDDAVPGIVKLIELSTEDGLDEREHVRGEDMIRAYLQNWDQVPQPIPADVVQAVKQALAAANPQKSVRTTYHTEFLKKVAEVPGTPPLAEPPSLPDVRWEGDEVTPEQIDTLAGKQWGTVTLIKDTYNGELIERLRHATSIRCLRLFGDDLGGQTGRLKQIAGLVELEIGTPLKSRELQAIGEMTQLTALSLPQEMTINVLGAREIARLKNLRSLRLYYVDIDDTAFAELAPLTQLEEIDLTHTRITDSGLSVLSKMPQLRSLELYRFPNWHTSQQLTDACLPVVCQLQKLERLSLSGEISDEGLKQVARLPKLKSLAILGSRITGEGLAALEHSTVESLLLSPQQVGTTGLENLKKCKSLKHILVTGRFDGLEEIEQWQTALPGVDWSFNDP